MAKIIETFSLTKIYPPNIIGVEDLCLEAGEGEIFGFLGSNGAGKTTTIRMLVNLLFPSRGRAEIFGLDVVKRHLEICRRLGYLSAAVRPNQSMTGAAFLSYMGRLSGPPDLPYRQLLLDRFGLSRRDLQRKIREYSSGMIRKISIIQAFQHRPRLVVLDEPTEGLDPVMQDAFYQLLREYRDEGGTVFISSHHLPEVEQVCDRVAIIRQGKLALTERIADLKKHIRRRIQVAFASPAPEQAPECSAWEVLEYKNNILSAWVTGEVGVIVRTLADYRLNDIIWPPASLQEVFLGFYREEGKS